MALPETLAELRDCIAAQHDQLTGRLRDAARFTKLYFVEVSLIAVFEGAHQLHAIEGSQF